MIDTFVTTLTQFEKKWIIEKILIPRENPQFKKRCRNFKSMRFFTKETAKTNQLSQRI